MYIIFLKKNGLKTSKTLLNCQILYYDVFNLKNHAANKTIFT